MMRIFSDNSPFGAARLTGWRAWTAVVIVALTAANLARLAWASDLEAHFKFNQEAVTVLAGLGLLLVWFALFSGLRWRARLTTLAALLIGAFVLSRVVRLGGAADGSGRRRLVWKWTGRHDPQIGGLTVAATGAAASSGPTATADFPRFRGRDARGAAGGSALESDWAAHPPRELWRQAVGLGWSGFAVAGDWAITQEQRAEQELTVAYELATGRVLWAHTNQTRLRDNMGGDGPRATPTVAGDQVFALGGTGILDCLALTDGRLAWSRDLQKEEKLTLPVFGKSSSPLLVDDLVVVTGGMAKDSALLAYWAADGRPAWRAGADSAGYSSPCLATLGGHRQILSVNAASVSGHDPRDGAILWRYAWSGALPKCSQPAPLDAERVFISGGFGAGSAVLRLQADAAGKFTVTEVWKNTNLKTQFSSAVLRDGFLYGLDDAMLVCLDPATGQRRWKEGRYGYGQILLAGDRLLIQCESGPLALVEANPNEYREWARLPALSSKTWNYPALAGDFLLVRNDREAVCYRLPTRVPTP